MNPLYLSGFGVSLNVNGAKLVVKDGFLEPDSKQQVHEFQPRRMPYDSVLIDGQTGSISLAAMKWLMRHGVPLFILDYNGTLLSSTLPREPVNGPLKIAQIEAYNNPAKRFYIAKKLIDAKAQRTVDVLAWLAERYGKSSHQPDLQPELKRLDDCASLQRLLSIEGRIADFYWRYLQRVLPDRFGFTSRTHESHQMNASDPANVLLNYGYAILESECRKAVNSVGLEPTVGFLHETRQTKSSLVFDLMEPYRWLVDTTVVESLDSQKFDKKDFYRTDNYVVRLRPGATRQLVDVLRMKLNSTVRYRNRLYSWDTLIRMKAQELVSHILCKRTDLSYIEPAPTLPKQVSMENRNRILSLTVAEGRALGIGKSSLWHLQKRARMNKPFRAYRQVRSKLSLQFLGNDY